MILVVDNEAACAVHTEGAAKSQVALIPVYALWGIDEHRDILIWTERVPTRVNPARLPPRGRELSSPTEPKQELASVFDLCAVFDLSWVIQRTK